MKKINKTILGFMLLGLCASANAEVVQVWECTLHDGKTTADLEKASSAWVTAVNGMKGGAEIKAYHEFPLAASPGANGFNFVMVAPDAAVWGAFWTGYDDSAALSADEEWDKVAECKGSSLWNSIRINK